jgi:hypothetical protein
MLLQQEEFIATLTQELVGNSYIKGGIIHFNSGQSLPHCKIGRNMGGILIG